jgi:hypothetical protein
VAKGKKEIPKNASMSAFLTPWDRELPLKN